MEALRCQKLVKRYGNVVAVDRLDLTVEQGECFGLLGPNGAGKTTTAEMLEGLIRPDDGTIQVLGESWGGAGDQQLRERLGVALQETRLTNRLTVEETVRLFRSFYRRGKAVDEVLALLDLTEKRHTWVSKLSGGLRQRLALACALVSDPDVLFLDEPTTGLDPQARLRIWEVIEEFKRGGGTTFLTTHYMEEAERLCDRVGIMDRGRLIILDTPEALIGSLDADQIIELKTAAPFDRATIEKLAGVRGFTARGELWVLGVDGLETTLPVVLAELERQGATIQLLKTHRTSLEDVFVHLTGRELLHG